MPPEDNPADDVQPTKEEWDRWERGLEDAMKDKPAALRLSDLAGPDAAGLSDVAVFVRTDGSESEPFVVGEFIQGRNVRIRFASHQEDACCLLTVRRLGRGRLEPALIVMEGDGPGWTPTSANINALPDPVRRYVHDLETRCDPAGDVARLSMLQDENAMLRAKIIAMAERIAAQAELLGKKSEATDRKLEGIVCKRCGGDREIPASREPCSTDMMPCPACATSSSASPGAS